MIRDVPAPPMNLVPAIRRARGHRLYSHDGRRILDLWQDGGRAILGHGGRMVLAAKSSLERGPNVPLMSPYSGRLERSVRTLIGESPSVRVFGNIERALLVVSSWLGKSVGTGDIRDPVHEVSGPVRLWRPFLPADRSPLSGLPERWALVLVLPALGDSPPQVVIFSDRNAPASDLIAPFRLAAIVRGIYDLAAAPLRTGIDLPGFTAVGPYLVAASERTKPADKEYRRRFAAMLKAGFLISPSVLVPSIVPAEMSAGERAGLRRAAAISVQSGT